MKVPAIRFWGLVMMPVAVVAVWRLPEIIMALSP